MSNCKECSRTSCPWAFTEESEQVQNYGCLPTPQDTIVMYLRGNSWACHSDQTRPCIGAIKRLKELELYEGIKPLLTLDDQFNLNISEEERKLLKKQDIKTLKIKYAF